MMADTTIPSSQLSYTPNGSTPIQTPNYCAECGHSVAGGAFCQQCGSSSSSVGLRAKDLTAEQLVVPRQSNDRTRSRPLLVGTAVIGVILLAGTTVGIVALLGRNTKGTPSYAARAGGTLAPVLADNTVLSVAVGTLTPGTSPQVVRSALATALAGTRAAQGSFVTLATPKSQLVLASQINSALTSELAWLQSASAVLNNPASPELSQLSGLGVDAQTRIQTLGASVPAAATTAFPSSTQIVSYATAAVAKTAAAAQAVANESAAKARQAAAVEAAKAQHVAAVKAAEQQSAAAVTQFSNQVLGLLNQSTSSRQAISSFYQQLETVVDGGTASFTLAQAEQQISTIVANRTTLAAATQALSTPDPAAQAVDADLTAAFTASLADDTDLDNCLNENNDGSEAFIFNDCLSASTADASTATADKQTFLDAYNQLRATVGQPPVNLGF